MPLRPDVMRRIWIVSFLGVTVSGCVSSASEAVRTVRYTDDVKACTRLATVESTFSLRRRRRQRGQKGHNPTRDGFPWRGYSTHHL